MSTLVPDASIVLPQPKERLQGKEGADEEQAQQNRVTDFDETENHIYRNVEDLQVQTNFDKEQLKPLWRLLHDRMKEFKLKEGEANLSTIDALVLYLSRLSQTLPPLDRATSKDIVDVHEHDSAINRIREHLNYILKQRWWNRRLRPTMDSELLDPTIGLIVGAHVTNIAENNVPSAGKASYKLNGRGNWTLKSEIAISTANPHICLFISPAYPGSESNYGIHKRFHRNYEEYLRMTDGEADKHDLHGALHHWKIAADETYDGAPVDTQPLMRALPIDVPQNEKQKVWNAQHAGISALVSQFSGRVKSLWRIFSATWDDSLEHYDMDFENACLLTNELLATHHLEAKDAFQYATYLQNSETLAQQ